MNGPHSIDLREGNDPAARQCFPRFRDIEQAIGGRAGEATILANLASIDLTSTSPSSVAGHLARYPG